ncbi:MAG: peptidase U32 family protein, partial [Caldicoprobacterales bacterium]
MKRQIELLAPAGSKEALIAAVQNGADAVYLGAGKYNARRMADNFTDMDLKEVVEYAHLYGVKIYITLNILIKERELRDIRGCLDYLKDLCVDGLIVQDLGLAKIVAKDYPELSLHASTQMTIHQLEGAKVIEDLGFSRVVLARELSLEEIRQISEKTSLELETFVHGALCVSYSGQCLMSSMVGGRSGNRGMCAQPCRMLYRLESKQ